MKTDALFHELFQFDPQSLLQLVGLSINSRYRFDSITTKTTEKRLDGFFRSEDGSGPHLFLEVQGYLDSKIYWRLFREICTFYEQRDDTTPFIAIVLFIDSKYDPGLGSLAGFESCQLIRADLQTCLNALGNQPSVLTALKPLVLPDKAALPAAVAGWKAEIDSLSLPPDRMRILYELLEYAILQKFPKLSLEELRAMVQLTPLENAVAVQELMRQSKAEEHRRALARERALLVRQTRKRFGDDCAERLALLLEPIAKEERLDEIGEWIVECENAEALLAKVQAG